ncbi:winged helix-turn-helix domain-containing protein [Acidicapsa ligni]|uniref:winged helix-turn-helix domain-containing protein n=1 Tax=Acidicapsa ligni TaxID=542300 RepID=UPI0021DF76A3|nr:winged helix-turn-helix domain-containing protein [Acidicapsa ligni]
MLRWSGLIDSRESELLCSNSEALNICAVVTKDEIFVFGEYRLDAREHRVWRGDTLISLSPKTFDLLVIMLQGAGRLLDKDYLIRSVWPDSYVQDANLSVHIASLRKILGKTSDAEQFIETVPKVGYRFVVPVSRLPYAESLTESQTGSLTGPELADSASGPAPAIEQLPPIVDYLAAPAVISSPQIPKSPQTYRGDDRNLRVFLLPLLLVVACLLGVLVIRLWATRRERPPENVTSTRPLTSTPGLFLQPSFSSDGQELAYTWRSGTDSHQSIYLQHVSSDDRHILIDTGHDDYSPSWSPRGSEIAFLHSVGDDQPLEVLIVKKQNPALRRQVATICGADDAFRNTPTLSWSPDARTLVTTDCGGKNESPSLVLISVDTGQKRRLTHAPPRTVDDQAAFSPDGTLIAFRRSQGDSSDEIYLVPATGGLERKLTSRANPVDGLAWSSDGRSILFSSGRATSLGSIWSLPLTGGSPTAVTTPLTHTSTPTVSAVGHRMAYVDSPNNVSVWRLSIDPHSDAEPFITSNFFDASAVYSPDGTHVAFRSDRSGANEIWICKSDGSEPKKITHFDGPMTGSPRWSPDGRSLAFDSRGGGRANIFVVNLDSGESARITDSAATNSDNLVPSWSHDGSAIYFSSNRTGDWQIWRHALDTGVEAQITSNGGFNAMETSDGKSFIYVSDMGRTEIRRLSLHSAHEDLPLASLGQGMWHSWTISQGGLFYLTRLPSSASTTLSRLDLKSGKVQVLGQTAQAVNDSISISADGRSVLFARRSNTNTSIMILDGWN